MTTTTTTAIPERITAEHYQMQSSRGNRTYNLIYNFELQRWVCDCPDVRINKNTACKHRRRLVDWIASERGGNADFLLVQREATAIADSPQEPAPIATAITETTIYGMMDAIMKAEITIKTQGDRIACLEYDLQSSNKGFQATIAEQGDRIDNLENIIVQLVQQIALTQSQLQTAEALIAAKPTAKPTAKREPKKSQDQLDWEEYERDPAAWRAKQKGNN